MCEDRWQGEDDGTALICDGTAAFPVQPLKLDMLSAIQEASAHMLAGICRRIALEMSKAPLPTETLEAWLHRTGYDVNPPAFVWIEEELPHAKSQTEAESEQVEE